MPTARRKSNSRGRTSLGFKRQEFSDDISRLFIRLYPDKRLPALIPCMAQPRGTYGGVRCKLLFCSRCHNQRQRELQVCLTKAMETAVSKGAGMIFVTVTTPHDAGEPLDRTMSALYGTWQLSRKGQRYKNLRKRQGLWGIMNVPDITFSKNGWHVHFHSVLFAETQDQAEFCANILKERYCELLEDLNLNPNEHTVKVQHVPDASGLAGYLAKSWHKRSNEGVTPLRLLKRAKRGCLASALLYFEAFEAFKGKQRGAVHRYLARKLRDA